jgi:hypothetical protein
MMYPVGQLRCLPSSPYWYWHVLFFQPREELPFEILLISWLSVWRLSLLAEQCYLYFAQKLLNIFSSQITRTLCKWTHCYSVEEDIV